MREEEIIIIVFLVILNLILLGCNIRKNLHNGNKKDDETWK